MNLWLADQSASRILFWLVGHPQIDWGNFKLISHVIRILSRNHRDPEVETKVTEIFLLYFFSLKILLGYCKTSGLSLSRTLNPQSGVQGGPNLSWTPKMAKFKGRESNPPLQILAEFDTNFHCYDFQLGIIQYRLKPSHSFVAFSCTSKSTKSVLKGLAIKKS